MNAEQTLAPQSRRFSPWLFVLLVFALSWPFLMASLLAPMLLQGDGVGAFVVGYVLRAASLCMVGLGAFIAGRYLFRDGFANAGWRGGAAAHYVAVLCMVGLLWGVPLLVALRDGAVAQPVGGLSANWALQMVLRMAPILLAAFLLEFAWRGYLLPRLAGPLSPRVAVLVHALICWLWWLPALAARGAGSGLVAGRMQGAPLAPAIIISLLGALLIGFLLYVSQAIVSAWFWAWSGSLWVAVFFHAANAGSRDLFHLLVNSAGRTNALPLALLVITALVLLAVGPWDRLTRGPDGPTRAGLGTEEG